MDEDWDWDWDPDVTGDPQLDQFGYQSPRRRGQNLTGFTASPDRDWLAQAKADRAQREQRRGAAAETRRRVAQRRGKPVAAQPVPQPAPPTVAPQPVAPDLAPHVAQAVAQGMPGRDLGWWRVDVDSTGRAVWQRVAAPGDGPRITVEQTPAPAAAPQPARWQWRRPAELTEPDPGTQVW